MSSIFICCCFHSSPNKGGLAASAAGLMYFTRLRDEIDLRRIYTGMDKIRIHIDRSGGSKKSKSSSSSDDNINNNNNNSNSNSSSSGVSTTVDAVAADGDVVVVEGGEQKQQPSEIIVIDARVSGGNLSKILSFIAKYSPLFVFFVVQPDSEFSIPLPVITVAGWSIMFALTASWAWYQARHRLQSR